jgi:basic membrane protein A and related proteins
VTKMRLTALAGASIALALAIIAGSAASGSQTATSKGQITAALISDIGKFNDKSFNENQLTGLLRTKRLGVKTIPLQSNSASDYIPNLTSAVRQNANIVIAAGFLLADSVATVAKQFPNTNFAITDYSVHAAPFADKKGNPLFKNVEGLTYNSNEAGCLVGVLAAKMAQKDGKSAIGAVGGLKIPPVDIYIAGYQYCAQKVVPGIKVLIGYSQDFNAQDKCHTVAQNQISQGSDVEFQVAGGCGLGALKAADDANVWGIGVDVDQYNLAKDVLTSAVKRVDVGVYTAVAQEQKGKFAGGSDLVFNLKDGGISVGKISPKVPASYIALMNSYKKQIIAGTLKVPTALS